MAIKTVNLALNECTCERCGHTWYPKVKKVNGHWENPVPVCCADCKTPYWNIPKK